MNVLFLTIGFYKSFSERSIYTDLLRAFIKHGHHVTMISSTQTKLDPKTSVIQEGNSTIIRVYTGRIQKTNLIEKGINTVLVERRYINAIKKYCSKISYNLVLYPTPPVTYANVVQYVKKRDGAQSYLLLKDIHPQAPVDLGFMSKNGLKGIIYRYFRIKEKKLYAISDHIGCMSEANVKYILKHNPEISEDKVEICPNSIEVVDTSIDENAKKAIREKYGISLSKTVFIYGGNLGPAQGIPFLIKCIDRCKDIDEAFFLIVGSGTRFTDIQEFYEKKTPKNMLLLQSLPKQDYDMLVSACDVGLIFLDHRFTIPNFPSRLLSYMQAKQPVLAITDPYTDVGTVIVTGGFGWRCESNDVDKVHDCVKKILISDIKAMGEKGFEKLNEDYCVAKGYEIISKSLKI